MTRPEKRAVCVRCLRRRERHGRNLCDNCYRSAVRNGTITDWPRSTWARDDLLEEWTHLAGCGFGWRDCASILGMTYPAFECAMLRARAADDPRARRGGEAS